MKNFFICCLMIMVGYFSLSAESPRFIVSSGHTGAVTSFDYNANEDLVFSSGTDGTVKVWDRKDSKLIFQYQISHMPVQKVIACRANPFFAAIESDGINAINLSVWNWETGERLFKQRLPEIPLFLNFSPKGNFIVYGKTDWDSLVFIDAETGKSLPYLQDGFGIVSAAFISDSEKTILTYSNSGYIQYWDLDSGKRKTRIPTFTNLQQISFVSSGRYMTAYNGSELLLIDLIRGSRIDSIAISGPVMSAIDRKNDSLVWVTGNGRDTSYHSAAVTGSGFNETTPVEIKNTDLPSGLLSVDGNFITSGLQGGIFIKKRYSDQLSVFADDNLLHVNDFAIGKNSIAITAPGKLLSISSDFFIKEGTSALQTEVGSEIYPLDAESTFGISTAEGDNFLLWPSSSKQGGFISVFDGDSGELRPISDLKAPLISAEYRSGKVLTLNINGDCRLLDYESGEKQFEYSSFGLRTVDFIENGNIIAGRNSTAALPSPLLHINTRTGETVPIDDSDLLIFDLQHDFLTGKLYSIGFEKRNDIMRTVLKEHTGRNYDRAETIMAFPGEDFGATFTSDIYSSKIFTSLGYGGVKMLYWGGFTSLENPLSIPRSLKLRGNILVSLNQDSSFSIWNPSTGERVMNLYIFKDLSWAALLSNDRYYASPGAEKYIGIYSSGETRELSRRKYRILSTDNR